MTININETKTLIQNPLILASRTLWPLMKSGDFLTYKTKTVIKGAYQLDFKLAGICT